MRINAHCSCGWRRELSEFYAGKRIRCPDCLAVVDVPGDSTQGLYTSSLPPRPAREGRWVPARDGAVHGTSRCGTGLFVLVIAIVVAINGLRLLRPDPWTREMLEPHPVECTGPATPSQSDDVNQDVKDLDTLDIEEAEDGGDAKGAAPAAKPAREYTPPTDKEDEF